MRKLTNIQDLEKCIIRKGNDALTPVYDGGNNLVISEELLDLPEFEPFKKEILAITEPHEYVPHPDYEAIEASKTWYDKTYDTMLGWTEWIVSTFGYHVIEQKLKIEIPKESTKLPYEWLEQKYKESLK